MICQLPFRLRRERIRSCLFTSLLLALVILSSRVAAQPTWPYVAIDEHYGYYSGPNEDFFESRPDRGALYTCRQFIDSFKAEAYNLPAGSELDVQSYYSSLMISLDRTSWSGYLTIPTPAGDTQVWVYYRYTAPATPLAYSDPDNDILVYSPAVAAHYTTYHVALGVVGSVNATVSGSACEGGNITLGTNATSAISYAWSGPSGFTATTKDVTLSSATPAMSGIYTLTVTSGCVTTVTTNVVVSSFTMDPITGMAALCTGGTTTLSNTTGGGTWQSGNTAVAAINTSTGVVTGIAPGTATISYTASCGAAATMVVTVDAAAISIAGNANICQGLTTSLVTAAAGGVWSSDNGTIASVNASGLVTGVAVGTATISYQVSNTCGTLSAAKVVSVDVLPVTVSLSGASAVCIGTSTTLTTSDAGGTWSSSNSTVATVDPLTGSVTGMVEGTAAISYTITNSCGTTTASVPLTVVTMPATITGAGTVSAGLSATLSCTTPGGTWSSADEAIAIINATTGVYTGQAAGVTTMSYTTASGCYSTKAVTITAPINLDTGRVCIGATITMNNYQGAGVWSSSNAAVAVINASTGVVTGVSAGNVYLTFTPVSGTYSTRKVVVSAMPNNITGAMQVCQGVTATLICSGSAGSWSSSNTAIGTIGVSSGIAGGISAGTVIMTFTVPTTGCKRIATVTVNPMLPAISGSLSACASATAALSNSVADGTWSSSNVGRFTVSASGLVTGVSAGTATVSYIHPNGCKTSAVVTVNSIPAAIGAIPAICAGSSATLTDATAGGTWSAIGGSGSVNIGMITGVVTGITPGTVTVSYSMGTGCARTATITVSGALPAIGGSTAVCTGGTSTLSIAAGSGVWTSSMPSIASVVAGNGVMTGVSEGTATMTYSVTGGCKATTVVTVNTAPGIITGTLNVCVDATTALSSTGTGVWSSGNTGVGTVDAATGIVTGTGAGTVTITKTGGAGCAKTVNVTVKALPNPITGTGVVCMGGRTTLINAGNTGTWTSGNIGVASIGASSGVVTPVSSGTATITYTNIALCRITREISVNATASAGMISGPSGVVMGNMVTLASDGAGGGTWSSSDVLVATVNASSGVVTGVSAGLATIRYTANNGCGAATSTYPVTVSTSRPSSSGGNGNDANTHFIDIYPNPTTGRFSVNTSVAGTLVVYTVEGKLAAEYVLQQGIAQLELNNGMAPGVYMCRFNGGDGTVTAIRLILEQ